LINKLHIIAFTIPYPANYGGVIDVFYKLKALHQKGVKITLHCFQYDRKPAEELEPFCDKVYYYPRKMVGMHMLGFHPFIVSSRKSELLVERLLKDTAPILFEGLHTCFSINDSRLKDRKKIVRSHNIEHDYYSALASIEKKTVKRLYFNTEAKKLKRFETIAYQNANLVLGISQKDTDYLQSKYGNAQLVSAFHQFNEVVVPEKTMDFAFYHGNLSVGENNEAALYLVNEVFTGSEFHLKIAGNQPSAALKKACAENANIDLYENFTSTEINEMLSSARVNVLPTFQSTGIKLKLLAALFSGGHCLVNSPMVIGTSLEELVTIADTTETMKSALKELLKQEFPAENISFRKEKLVRFQNKFTADCLIKVIEG
tara:strand:+ start:1224 stop:2342 length:1119 start_codon:yes stop_codon:yes gene_type:complete